MASEAPGAAVRRWDDTLNRRGHAALGARVASGSVPHHGPHR
ncbi:MAG: hypothetical protein AVDCRST_MAG49-3192 [uncultured Thermomicrobiales bacterium]|uniref:Uncharacterized protein n=1 Tax=uncultured Thermomicrobiales bacterium TaxID=1645740 RepID=A0A6J4V440_9BACT|nr:MAG: hypothetical protein AVDCRST_MAG49-3192 [uncultured Thermomicrobiales bacterium]